MTDKEHTQSIRKRLEEAKAELKAQNESIEDLEALLGRDAHRTRVEPAQMRAAEAAFEKALAEAPEPAPVRPVVSREDLHIPSFALFA